MFQVPESLSTQQKEKSASPVDWNPNPNPNKPRASSNSLAAKPKETGTYLLFCFPFCSSLRLRFHSVLKHSQILKSQYLRGHREKSRSGWPKPSSLSINVVSSCYPNHPLLPPLPLSSPLSPLPLHPRAFDSTKICREIRCGADQGEHPPETGGFATEGPRHSHCGREARVP